MVQTVANVRNAYWDLVFARSAVDVARRAAGAGRTAWSKTTRRASRSARWRRSTSCRRRRKPPPAARRWRRRRRPRRPRISTLKRFLVNGTEDPLWRQELRAGRRAVDSAAAHRRRSRGAPRHRPNGPTSRPRARTSRPTTSTCGSSRTSRCRRSTSTRATARRDWAAPPYIRQGSGLGSTVIGTIPGGYSDALALIRDRSFPTWNLSVTMSYPIMAATRPRRSTRARACSVSRRRRGSAPSKCRSPRRSPTRRFTVQANLRRVEASTAARELAQKRLEAEQSRFEVGLTTNFFVVQAQRDLARRRRTPNCGRWPTTASRS